MNEEYFTKKDQSNYLNIQKKKEEIGVNLRRSVTDRLLILAGLGCGGVSSLGYRHNNTWDDYAIFSLGAAAGVASLYLGIKGLIRRRKEVSRLEQEIESLEEKLVDTQ